MKRFLKSLVLVVCGAAASMLLVMCGPPGMNMMGDAMVDVGTAIRDGSDTSMPDAMAQDCATDCTGGGVLRVMTADTDPDQLVSDYVRLDNRTMGSNAYEILVGPFILTDIGLADDDIPHTLLTVTDQAACPVSEGPPNAEPLTSIVHDGTVSSTTTRYVNEVHGGRYLIPAGSRLCAVVNASAVYGVRYAGFRPYD